MKLTNSFGRKILLLLLSLPLAALAGGDEVVVVYNSRLPESWAVAEHYAQRRQVPARQVFGFPLTPDETISRADFTDTLQKPLAEKLESLRLWKFGEVTLPAKNGNPAKVETRVVSSQIRYAVLCCGVPLKIAPAASLDELQGKLMGEQFRRNEAAVDSELAWLPEIKTKVPLTGPLPNPFYGCTNPAALNCTNGILLVSRLDGPTTAIARSLVDKALAAEKAGLWGRAYFDARGLVSTNAYYLGDQWILEGAEISRRLGFEVEVDNKGDTLPSSFPMSHIALYAGWYAGEVNGPFALPRVEFMPGAFAYHLHSFSADTVRSPTRNWCGPLLAKGATCTMGCVYEPFLQFTPNIAVFLQAFGQGYTFGEAAWVSQNCLSWQTTVIGDPLYQPFKKPLPDRHAELLRDKNPLIEWSFDRLVCLDLTRGVRAPMLEKFLEAEPTTARSAILTEKLGELYFSLGKPSSAISAWQSALKLNPSPQQRLRLRLTLGEKLTALGRDAEALAGYRAMLDEAPDYPGRNSVLELIQSSERKVSLGRNAGGPAPAGNP